VTEPPRPLVQPGNRRRPLGIVHALQHGGHFRNPPRPLPHAALQYEAFALARNEHQADELSQQQRNDGGGDHPPKQRLRPQ
jgi:hypothetical protein